MSMLSRALPSRPTGWIATRALLLVAATVVVGLALAVTRAEASGDAFGDSASSTGGLDGLASDAEGAPDGTIVQIGTTASGGVGSVTVFFDDNIAFNGPGADVRVHVVDADFPAEATIEVSADGAAWVTVGDFFDISDVSFDLGSFGLDYAVAVRITNLTTDTALLPGFDVDAVEALHAIDLIDLTLELAPASSQNLVATDHTVTASLDVSGTPVEGALVSFLITAGPNSAETSSGVTNAAGEAAWTFSGDDGAGTDSISAWLDLDDDGAIDAGEPQATAAKEWLALGDITALDLEPETDTNALNTSHTVTATLTPALADVEVRFRVVGGPNSGDVGTATSAADGTAGFTYTGDGGAGTDTITAWIDVDGEGDIDAGEPQDSVEKIWEAAGSVTAISLSPASDTNTVGSSHSVTATVTPQLSSVLVRFAVLSGPNKNVTGSDGTDANGEATFTYTGSGGAGTDVIVGWVDVDGDTTIDVGEPQAVATKLWVSSGVTSLALSPNTDTNQVLTSHTVTATVSPVTSGVELRFEVTSGPNAGTKGAGTTNAGGQTAFTYTGGATVGTDVIVGWIDDDGDMSPDSGEPQAVAVKTWIASTAAAISLAPSSDTNTIGTSHTVTATVSPVASGEQVRFRVSAGPNAGTTGLDTTDANGKATFSYSSTLTGTDVIVAWIDEDTDGVQDAGEPQAAAIKVWQASGAVSSIVLAPGSDVNVVGSAHTLTATVTPPLSGVLVRFQVLSGPHAGVTGADVTDANGRATHSYTGSTGGTDVITAWADLDGDGAIDTGEPQAIATKQWVTQPGLDGDVDGQGRQKVTICHVPPGNPGNAHTITIGAPAVPAHLAHGDATGACATSSVSSAPSTGAQQSASLALRIGAECAAAGEPGFAGRLRQALKTADPVRIEALLAAGNCDQVLLELEGEHPGKNRGQKQQSRGRGRD
jgi:hypothetical protein